MFLLRAARYALEGPPAFRALLAVCAFFVVVGFAAWVHQLEHGLAVTAMSDAVSWGAYIANFTFLVGVAAAAVLLVFPAYALKNAAMKEVVLYGELLAVAALLMCLAFVVVDIGHPERALHLVPGIGLLNLPSSILAWDVVALNGYLALNGFICSYVLYSRYRGRTPNPQRYLPLVWVSMFWAISIHTVTAFLYSGLDARPFWNSAILAPRFLVSAFAGGPAILLIIFGVLARYTPQPVSPKVLQILLTVVRVTLPVNLFLLFAELFVELYSDTLHGTAAHYLYLGIGEATMLVPWMWLSLVLSLSALVVFFQKRLLERPSLLFAACAALVVGIWIEKGMGLIIPGFVPTPAGEIVEYTPSVVEILVCGGIWAGGVMLYALLARVALGVQTGVLRDKD